MNSHTQYLIEKLTEQYNPEHDLFSNQPIQMNHIDARLLDIIQALEWDNANLRDRVLRLEVFVGMVAPLPLPVSEVLRRQIEDQPIESPEPLATGMLESLVMHFVTHNDQDIHFQSSWLQGQVSVTYACLVRVFGQPKEGFGKTDAEWVVLFADGTIATIYNYKDGKNYNGDDGLPTNEITEWHIGGQNERAVELVKLTLSAPLPASETQEVLPFATLPSGEDEPTETEIAGVRLDRQIDEFADYAREAKYGKQL